LPAVYPQPPVGNLARGRIAAGTFSVAAFEPDGSPMPARLASPTSDKARTGQRYLASGVAVAMPLWDREPPGRDKPETARDYETVGYVIEGRAELDLEGQVVILEPGNSWVVPRGSRHTYRILEPFTAVEATHPPAHIHGRDQGGGSRPRPD
jgi:quercetin dioxygenase-like cupin family protein